MQCEYKLCLDKIRLNFVYQVTSLPVRWCKPCHTLGERLEEEVGRKSGQVELARVDVDQLQELAIQYDVSHCIVEFISSH